MVVFKLVRTDTEEPCKIQLPPGRHSIGRGQFLSCDDKRVSRFHGELEVVDKTVTIKALHQNPCFYIKKDSVELQILQRNDATELCNGDKFGLLPTTYWFELLQCNMTDVLDQEKDSEGTEPLEITTVTNETTQLLGPEVNKNNKSSEDNADVDNIKIVQNHDQLPGDENPIDFNFDETVDEAAPKSPSMLYENPELQDNQLQVNTNISEAINKSPDGTKESTENSDKPDEDAESPRPTNDSPSENKRPHSPDSEAAKKIKVEPDQSVKQEPEDVKPGPSNDNVANAPTNPAAPASPQKQTPAPARERCIYGANCYRKNPQHRLQYSHPSDADYSNRACPYGAGCRRRDPRHWTHHDHPPGTAPPPHQRPGKAKTKRQVTVINSDDDEELDAPVLDRASRRKKAQRLDLANISGSDEEKDPFDTDESDEWLPSSDTVRGTDGSQFD